MKLTAEKRRAILNEMQLAELFTLKSWCQRYNVSERTAKRLRAEAREILAKLALKGPVICHVMMLTDGGRTKPAPRKAA